MRNLRIVAAVIAIAAAWSFSARAEEPYKLTDDQAAKLADEIQAAIGRAGVTDLQVKSVELTRMSTATDTNAPACSLVCRAGLTGVTCQLKC
ncbi:hypothetical protein LOF21_25505 [Sinorhizobium meliloti]|uniref:hypothetical protein n=1 Tax=Rhizobium meliloti TaxID=382 RepID=UPI0004898806|nr:hypothetical protein [Sinorhizobium meliloti]MDE3832004.1 hypothetical protein [Sinorhizobium meliloti]MDE4580288.1 hypothetical protein [Sinorhizobium meliloti]